MFSHATFRRTLLALLALGNLAFGPAAVLAVEQAPAPARATMQQVYTAATLYTCPMHPAVVSADPKLDCPLCEMHLAPMSADARKALTAQKLAGCPMDPIVVKAEDAANCPVCGMKLTVLAAPALHAEAAGTAGAAAPAAGACCKAAAGAAAAAGCQGACCKVAAGGEQTAPGSHNH